MRVLKSERAMICFHSLCNLFVYQQMMGWEGPDQGGRPVRWLLQLQWRGHGGMDQSGSSDTPERQTGLGYILQVITVPT